MRIFMSLLNWVPDFLFLFKVTLDAVNDCKVLRLSDANVLRVFDEDPDLKFLVNCVVSKDITRKLYVINDNVYSASKRAR